MQEENSMLFASFPTFNLPTVVFLSYILTRKLIKQAQNVATFNLPTVAFISYILTHKLIK